MTVILLVVTHSFLFWLGYRHGKVVNKIIINQSKNINKENDYL
jgi:hypothetical protein